MLHSLFTVFEQVRPLTSLKEKGIILGKLSTDDKELMRKLAYNVFNSFITYGVKVDDRPEPTLVPSTNTLDDAAILKEWDHITSNLADRNITGNKARTLIDAFLDKQSPFVAYYFTRFFNKEFVPGVNLGIMTKIFGKRWVPDYVVALAGTTPLEKLDWNKGLYVEPKMDGLRANIIIDEDGITSILSRGGKPFYGHEDLIEEIKSIFGNGVVVDGELFGKTWNVSLSGAKTKNRKEDSDEKSKSLSFYAFDIIPYNDFFNRSCNIPLHERKQRLAKGLENISEESRIIYVPHPKMYSAADAIEKDRQYLTENFEGSIIKDPDSLYEFDAERAAWTKIKMWDTDDFRIVGVVHADGTEQYVKKFKATDPRFSGPYLSAVILEVADDGTTTKCGAMTESLRLQLSKMGTSLIGNYAEVKFQESGNMDGKSKALRFPCKLIKYRPDKSK